jgi:uncharacterized protein (DUF2235 family)
MLFSDGTGNSSAKLFKTNVWRLYEAVDLGPSPPEERDQIAYYDDGVGTSAFRPLALLGGILGVGLKRNVLDIYTYACRNYRKGDGQTQGENPDGLGDHIYGFGFSRGAFTMRLAISLLATEGVVEYRNERDLGRKAADAYRHFCSLSLPRRHPAREITWALRKTRNGMIWCWRKLMGQEVYRPDCNYKPVLRFVGVWDTVAAYGGPVTEITRAIDNWIWPLSMPNYQLNESIVCARHALALDDERDSFHPLLWDEVAEKEFERKAAEDQEKALDQAREARAKGDWALFRSSLDKARKAGLEKRRFRGRLQQVWFTGMHSDVGGGYPDESLSYVSLLWMIEEAEKAGLRTLDVVTERYVAMANSYGPMHDSRQGLAAYFRYQPRKVAAWIEPPGRDDWIVCSTLSLRDPTIADRNGRPRGLLLGTRVHESVIARIATGTDRYAPLSLPETFDIVPAGRLAEQQYQAVEGGGLTPREREQLGAGLTSRERDLRRRKDHRLVTNALAERLTHPDAARARAHRLERVWNYVWIRRVSYFIALALTLLLATMPVWIGRAPEPPTLADGRTWIGGIIGLLALLLPGFASDWIQVYADNPFYFLALGLSILLSYLFSNWLERVLRDRGREVWRSAVGIDPPADEPESEAPSARRSKWQEAWRAVLWAWRPIGKALRLIRDAWRAIRRWLGDRLMTLRNSFGYQRSLQLFKWRILPDLFFGPLLLGLVVWLALSFYVQAALPALENGDQLCKPSPARALSDLTAIRRDFRTRDLCSTSLGRVQKDQRYVVTLEVVESWKDGSLPASPEGVRARDFPWGLGYLGVPLRRVVDASYLQPLFEIRPRRIDGVFRNVRIDMLEMKAGGDSPTVYRSEFVARKTGELFIFANDAMLPFDLDTRFGKLDYAYFYTRSGSGKARGNRGTACLTVESADAAGKPMGPPPSGGICAEAARRAAAAVLSDAAAGKASRPPAAAE